MYKGVFVSRPSHPRCAKHLATEHFNSGGNAGLSGALYHSSSPARCTHTLGTAEPCSSPAPAPACKPLQHGPAGSLLLQCTALARARTEDALALSLQLGGKLKQRDVNFSSQSEPGSPALVKCGWVGAPRAGGGTQES